MSWSLVILVFVLFCNPLFGKNVNVYYTDSLPNISTLVKEGMDMASEGSYILGAQTLHNGNRILQSPELYLYATLLYAKGSDFEKASAEMIQSIDAGMSNWNIIAKDQALDSIKQSSNWLIVKNKLDSIKQSMSDPASFEVSLEPISSFVSVGDHESYRYYAETTFEKFIMDGSKGVRDYYTIMYKNPTNASNIIRENSDVYTLVEELYKVGAFNSISEFTEKYVKNFSNTFDGGTYPTVYLMPGIFTSGGTATNVGTFIGVERFVEQARDTSGKVDSAVLYDAIEKIPYTIFHELMHFQQAYSEDDPSTVIYKVIEEGAATFLTTLFTGGDIEEISFGFLQDSTDLMRVLDSLQNDLFTSNTSAWVYNEDRKDWPRDIGYYIGAEICRSYYLRHSDKRVAVEKILTSKNMVEIVRGSEYKWILE